MNSSELEKICKQVIEVAKQAGAFVKNEASTFDLSRIEYKGAKDLVSYVDKKSEQIIVSGLKKILPEVGFITEEGTIAREEARYKWIVDPLDGTTNFLHKLPSYSISIALIEEKELLIGVVFDPNQGECFYAWKEGGAYCNGKKIQVSPIKELEKSLIVTGFPYDLKGKEDGYFKILRKFVDVTHGLRRLGSAAIDLCYVACGRFEAYYEFNVSIWDLAAGALIVKEAGGKVSDFSGGNDYLHGKELLAAGGAYDEALKVIQERW